jgi:hypothetical protein
MPTTAAQASDTTTTVIKTMLQVATPSTRQIQLIAWGFMLDDPPGADAVFELLDTDVAATVTAHVAAGVQPLTPGQPASLVTLGVAATGYTASAEGAIANTRVHGVAAMNIGEPVGLAGCNFFYQFMPDERPIIAVSRFVRVRATTPTTAVDMRAWVVWDE